jgi:photosystem II stability/assembly factor-like uncharacterized protein
MRWISFDNGSVRGMVAVAVVSLLLPHYAQAHSPHHIITDVAVEPSVDANGQVFIAVTDQVFRSDDRNSPWKNLDRGLDVQHTFTSIALSPNYADDETVIVATSGDGVFRSTDRGDSWDRFNSGLDTLHIGRVLAFSDSSRSRVLLATSDSGALWRRADQDDRWWQVLAEQIAVTALSVSPEGDDPPALLAGDQAGRIWRSEDGGQLWEIIAQLANAGDITSIASMGPTIFVGTAHSGILVSHNGGETFDRVDSFAPLRTHDCAGKPLENPVADNHVTSVVLSAAFAQDTTIFATTWFNAVHVSMDGGITWSNWSEGLSCNRQADTERLPHFSKLEFNWAADGAPEVWLAAFDGLFRTTGVSSDWHQLETLPLGMIKGFAANQSDEPIPAVALATYGGGFYLSSDLGRNWIIGNKGLATTRLTGIAFSQYFSDDHRIFAGADRRLLWSADGGVSWNRIELQRYGIGARIGFKLNEWGAPKRLSRMFYDPRDDANVYPTHIITQARPKQDEILFATRFHGVMSYNTTDGDIETIWAKTDRIMNVFQMSPSLASDNTLFASIRGEGVVRSTDAGRSWSPINTGLHFVESWARNPQGSNFRRDVQIAVSPDFGSDNMVFAGSAAAPGLYASRDRGDTWQRLSLLRDQESAPVLAIAISPQFSSDGTIVVSVRGHGLFRSQDRGDTFSPIGRDLYQENASIEYIAFSRRYSADDMVVAASDEDLFISTDRGESWTAVDRPVRYEDMRDVVKFDGAWTRKQGSEYSAMTETVSESSGSRVRLDFLGTGIRWVGSRGPGGGVADVYVDGELLATVNTGTEIASSVETLFSTESLLPGAHSIELVKVSGAGVLAVDAFDVLSIRQKQH